MWPLEGQNSNEQNNHLNFNLPHKHFQKVTKFYLATDSQWGLYTNIVYHVVFKCWILDFQLVELIGAKELNHILSGFNE